MNRHVKFAALVLISPPILAGFVLAICKAIGWVFEKMWEFNYWPYFWAACGYLYVGFITASLLTEKRNGKARDDNPEAEGVGATNAQATCDANSGERMDGSVESCRALLRSPADANPYTDLNA